LTAVTFWHVVLSRFFDEEGNYVEKKEEDPANKDAWLGSDEAKALSAEVCGGNNGSLGDG
jgi:hypothetical protein